VSSEEILKARTAHWCGLFVDWGYEIKDPPRSPILPDSVFVFARRPTAYGGPPLTATIEERWLEGSDPDGLRLELGSCYLAHSSWHAQFDDVEEGADRFAERLDVDRTKPADLKIHRHPFGAPNATRIPESNLVAPDVWLEGVELLVLHTDHADDLLD
jgi:hypothetical protein